MSVRVVAPSRLHFGLFHVPVDGLTHDRGGRPIRKFGGLGMMIENPCVTVTASEAVESFYLGPFSSHAAEVHQRFRALLRSQSQYHIDSSGPTAHTGLGVGTASCLSVVAAIFPATINNYRQPTPSAVSFEVFTRLAGRGKRSGIGVYGFRDGGFLLDDGKVDEELGNLAGRTDFPTPWRVVLVRPPTPPAWFGDRERTAFARTRPSDKALSLTERLRTLAFDTVVPAVRDAEFDTFAQSIFEFNRLAGEPFHDDQGGPYAGAEVACVIDELMEMGAVGVGQSSWGPTVFAMCRDADEAEHLAAKARARFSSATEVIVTTGNNTGARIETV